MLFTGNAVLGDGGEKEGQWGQQLLCCSVPFTLDPQLGCHNEQKENDTLNSNQLPEHFGTQLLSLKCTS